MLSCSSLQDVTRSFRFHNCFLQLDVPGRLRQGTLLDTVCRNIAIRDDYGTRHWNGFQGLGHGVFHGSMLWVPGPQT